MQIFFAKLGGDKKKMEEELKMIGLVVVVVSVVTACMIPLVMGEGTEVISCTVTAGVYSVSLSRVTVTYGNMAEGDVQSDPAGAITATNDAGIPEDLFISGADATGGGSWTLAATPGPDEYRHTFNNGTEYDLTASYKLLVTNIPDAGTQAVTLKIYVPTTIATTGTYATDVTIMATAP